MTKTVGCCLHIEAVIEGKGGDESTEGTVYTMKSRGPRTEPWRTAQEEVYKVEKVLLHLTRKEQNDKYGLNQLRTEPRIPNQDER